MEASGAKTTGRNGKPFSILQINQADYSGGAEKVAWDLFRSYRMRGYQSGLAVGTKRKEDADVFLIPDLAVWRSRLRTILHLDSKIAQGQSLLGRIIRIFAESGKVFDRRFGIEDFRSPGSWKLLDSKKLQPDVIHCHNLHGGYFDLRALAWLSQRIPVVLTLHDAWLLSGHCAHSFDCQRWQSGCGKCPDLTLYPAIQRDATHYNWLRKQTIYKNSRLYVATPSQWLMDKVSLSILQQAIVEARVIPYGIDLSWAKPGDMQAARKSLDLPQTARIALFVGNKTRSNPYKDFPTMEAAIAKVSAESKNQEIIFLCLGEEGAEQKVGSASIHYVGFQKDPDKVVKYYQAADVYLHAARADTFPNTILEALACGTPVVATAIGGIPEQIVDGKTGFLVVGGDSDAMAQRILQLFEDDSLRGQMSQEAAKDAKQRFDLERHADDYLTWYEEILN